MLISGSIQNTELETSKRLGVLYNKHHSWLLACAYNQSKNVTISEDLVQELYIYLGEKNNPKLYYRDSFNLLYCHNFISSRYINYIKRESKLSTISDTYDKQEDKYNTEFDILLEQTYNQLKDELKQLSTTKMWSSAKLFEMYSFADITMEELSNKIGISKSTTFLNIKKIKEHLKNKLQNPFEDEEQ